MMRKYISTDAEWRPDNLAMGFDPSDAELAEVWHSVFENGTYEEPMAKYDLTAIAVDAPVLQNSQGK